MTKTLVYKILTGEQWTDAKRAGRIEGAPIDLADGYIHLSTAQQARETAAKHFAGMPGLVLAAIDAGMLGHSLIYEISRGGALFPHYYGRIDLACVVWCKPLPLGDGGTHAFPELSA